MRRQRRHERAGNTEALLANRNCPQHRQRSAVLEPSLVLDADPGAGPVVVENTYTVATEKEEPFIRAMARVRLSRLRTGATQWGLFRDGETSHRFVELYVVPSWEEHMRQHADRLTGTDREYEEEAEAFSDPPGETSHLIAVDLPDPDL